MTDTSLNTRQARPFRRYRREARRALILDAAGACIAERGLVGTTAREIADRCGISTGTLTHHFPSMDDLLAKALQYGSSRFTDDLLRRLDSEASLLERLHVFIDGVLPDDDSQASAMWRLWLEYWARSAHKPELAVVHTERHRVLRTAVESVISEGVERGEFRDVDARRVAVEFIGLLDGLGLQAVVGDEEVDIETARAVLRDMLASRLLHEGDHPTSISLRVAQTKVP